MYLNKRKLFTLIYKNTKSFVINIFTTWCYARKRDCYKRLRLKLHKRGYVVQFAAGAGDILLLGSVRLAFCPHVASFRVGAGVNSQVLKRPGRAADHSPLC